MSLMLMYLYRQRRRLIFVGLLFSLAIILSEHERWGFLMTGDTAVWSRFLLGTASIFLITTVGAAFWIMLFPGLRNFPDVSAVTVFAIELAKIIGTDFIGNVISPETLGCIFILPYFISAYTPLLTKGMISFRKYETYNFVSRTPTETLWRRFVPLAKHQAEHWFPLLHDIQPDPAAPEQQIARYDFRTRKFYQQRQRFTTLDAPHNATYDYDTEIGAGLKPIAENTHSVVLTPRPDGTTKVTMTHDMRKVPVAMVINGWFDDVYGGEKDHLVAQDQGKADWSLLGRTFKMGWIKRYIRSISPWARPA